MQHTDVSSFVAAGIAGVVGTAQASFSDEITSFITKVVIGALAGLISGICMKVSAIMIDKVTKKRK